MNNTLFIIHGSYGSPNENWIPWLKTKLQEQNIEVIVPQFPTPKSQNLQNWLETFSPYKQKLKNSIIIAHSIGCAFTLSLLETNHTIRAAFLVAGFITPLGNEFDSTNKSFLKPNFNFNKIKNNCKEFHVYCSDNDPYVSPQHCQTMASKLGGRLNVVKNAGHFNSETGYTSFKILHKDIQKSLQKI